MRKIVAVAAVFIVAWAAAGVGAALAASVSERLTNFYRSPDPGAISAILHDIDQQGILRRKSVHAPIVGFIAGVYVRYPEHRLAWMSASYGSLMQRAIAMAVGFGGGVDAALRYANDHQLSIERTAVIARQKHTLLTMPLKGPADFDLMWGASFATGDPVYAARIIDKLSDDIKKAAIDPADIELVSKFQSGQVKAKELAYIKEKYTKKDALTVVVAASALWSLTSNAYQHDFIKQLLQDRFQSETDPDVAAVLMRALMAAEGHVETPS